MHWEEDCVFAAESGVITRWFGVHVDDDVRCCSGVVPERQCPVFVEQCCNGLEKKGISLRKVAALLFKELVKASLNGWALANKNQHATNYWKLVAMVGEETSKYRGLGSIPSDVSWQKNFLSNAKEFNRKSKSFQDLSGLYQMRTQTLGGDTHLR